MSKTDLIHKYFQKIDLLRISNSTYTQAIDSLFHWLTVNDHIENDITTKSLRLSSKCTAQILSHKDITLAGIEELVYLLSRHTNISFTPTAKDGDRIAKDTAVGSLKGSTNELLAYERTILNILQRMSGIATQTHHLVQLVDQRLKTKDQRPSIAATRKTPWMSLDKKAVAIGGGLTHRLNLGDGILIKDNHLSRLEKTHKITQVEATKLALDLVLSQSSPTMIEIEINTESQLHTLLNTWPKKGKHHLTIMLDNFSAPKTQSIMKNLHEDERTKNVIFEASGGINEQNISLWAHSEVDILSLGSLTHSVTAANLSLEL